MVVCLFVCSFVCLFVCLFVLDVSGEPALCTVPVRKIVEQAVLFFF